MCVCKVTTVLVALDVLGVVLKNNPVVWMTGRGGASFKRRSLGQSVPGSFKLQGHTRMSGVKGC